MRIATEHYKTYHRPRNYREEHEKESKGFDEIFGKPWYEEEDPELAEKKRREKGL